MDKPLACLHQQTGFVQQTIDFLPRFHNCSIKKPGTKDPLCNLYRIMFNKGEHKSRGGDNLNYKSTHKRYTYIHKNTHLHTQIHTPCSVYYFGPETFTLDF